MSHIAHNCTCGHFLDLHLPPQYAAVGDGRLCTCGCRAARMAESTVLPTFTHRGEPVPLEAPGGSMFGLPPRSCACASCRALFEELTTQSGAA